MRAFHKEIQWVLLTGFLFCSACASAPTAYEDPDPGPRPHVRADEEMEDPCSHTESAFRCVEFDSLQDGRTLLFNIPQVHPLFSRKVTLRLSGLAVPAEASRDKCESQWAKQAREYTTLMLKNARRIDLENLKRIGKTGIRLSGEIKLDSEQSLRALLLQHKFAYPNRQAPSKWPCNRAGEAFSQF